MDHKEEPSGATLFAALVLRAQNGPARPAITETIESKVNCSLATWAKWEQFRLGFG